MLKRHTCHRVCGFVCVGLISLLGTLSASAQTSDQTPLPNWFDPALEHQSNMSPPVQGTVGPLRQSMRVPAEYEPAQAVLLGFMGYESMLEEIAAAVVQHTSANVWTAGHSGSLPGVPANRLVPIGCPIDSVWMRDYGPFGIVDRVDASGRRVSQVGFMDATYRHYASRPNDDRLPACAAKARGLPAYPVGMILDGGNFMVDRQGNLFMTKRVYNWNSDKTPAQVDAILKQSYQVKSINVVPYAGYPGNPADGTGHIDMFAKLLADDIVLIAETSEQPYKDAIDQTVAFFTNLTAPGGGHYKILRVPARTNGRTWYTYTNSLIVNNTVLVPSYDSMTANETAVREAYEQAGLEVVFINADSSITSGGAIHCVTQLVPQTGTRD